MNKIIQDEEIEEKLNIGDTVYYARIIPNCKVYEIIELKIRTVEDDYFCGIDTRDKQAFLFKNSQLNDVVFLSRQMALETVKNAELLED